MEFVLIKPGHFVAGSPDSEPGHQADEKLYPVRIASAFYMAIHEVTRGEWAALMQPGEAKSGEAKPGEARSREARSREVRPDEASPDEATEAYLPVINLTWFEAHEFLNRLNRTNAGHFRLPTEVEWEYACRAGTTSPFSTGVSLTTDQANYNGLFPLPGQAPGQNRGHVTRVGSFPANAWGLHDMHGNVWEWTSEGYDEERKVIRGGSWRFNADSARCALRYTHRPQDRGDSLGFRVVREVPRP
jgi:formylglycine-generating enzyme required for sulfatase activity